MSAREGTRWKVEASVIAERPRTFPNDNALEAGSGGTILLLYIPT